MNDWLTRSVGAQLLLKDRWNSEKEKWVKSDSVWRDKGNEWEGGWRSGMLGGRLRQWMLRKRRLEIFHGPFFPSVLPSLSLSPLLSLVISQGHVLCILRNNLAKGSAFKSLLACPSCLTLMWKFLWRPVSELNNQLRVDLNRSEWFTWVHEAWPQSASVKVHLIDPQTNAACSVHCRALHYSGKTPGHDEWPIKNLERE